MREYFDKDGHLTEYAFYALEKDDIDTEKRFEIAEHLSFCDACLEKYTSYLTEDKLIENIPEEICENIFRRIKRHATKILFNKYSTVAIAASLSFTLWTGGVFNDIYYYSVKISNTDIKAVVSQKYEKNKKDLQNKLDKIIDNILDNKKEM